MSTEYYIAGFNWNQGSSFLPNANMESNSFWTLSGDTSSLYYTTSYFYNGLRSLAFKTIVSSSGTISLTQDPKLDSNLSKVGNAISGTGWGVQAHADVGYLGRENIYLDHLVYTFFLPNTITIDATILKAYISIKCKTIASGASPLVRYPSLSTEHLMVLGDAIGSAGFNYTLDQYEITDQHTPTFEVDNWYYGEGLPYAYNLASQLQSAVNSRGYLGTSDFINVIILGNSSSSISVGWSGFYMMASSATPPNSDTAVLNIQVAYA